MIPNVEAGKCEIRVGSEWRRWEFGKCIVFDDSFEHEVLVNFTRRAYLSVVADRFFHMDMPNQEGMEPANTIFISLFLFCNY